MTVSSVGVPGRRGRVSQDTLLWPLALLLVAIGVLLLVALAV